MCKYFYILFIKAYFDMKVILFLIAEVLDYWEKTTTIEPTITNCEIREDSWFKMSGCFKEKVLVRWLNRV